MPLAPEEQSITTIIEFTGMGRSDAIRWLKVKQNNLEAAINAIFNGESLTKAEEGSQWDEQLMSADRDGVQGDNNNWGGLRPFTGSAAATRHNSPAPSHRSTLQPTNREEEDADMARALAASQQDLRQETGVVGPGGQQTFGPATREHYERNQWALVPAGGATWAEGTEVVPDVELGKRLVQPGEPRSLKYLPSGDYLPNLIAICAAIEGAREAMLTRGHVLPDYGEDGEWWRGHPIRRVRIVHVTDGSAAGPEPDQMEELVAETQRLMAFLTESKRSYGSVDGLLETDVLKRTALASTQSRTLLELYLQSWAAAASWKSGEAGAVDPARLFNSTVGTNAARGIETPDMSLIDMSVTLGDGEKADLSELLDNLLWDADMDPESADENYIEQPAEVLVMRLSQSNPVYAQQLRVEVPADFYVDKYLKENIAATQAMRKDIAQHKRRLAKIGAIEDKLRYMKHPKRDVKVDAGGLLQHACEHFAKQQNGVDPAGNPLPDHSETGQKLDNLISNIRDKLEVLEQEKEKTRATIAEMSKVPAPGLEPEQLKHHYTLRGVATEPGITYVLYPNDPEVVDNELIDDDTTPPGYRWWRIQYKVTSDHGVQLSKHRVPDYDVLRAVELEHSSALLVYASDAITAPITNPGPLPQPLQEFIDRDNHLFMKELQNPPQQANTYPPPPGPPPSYSGLSYDLTDVPRESIERRNSIDSTRAEGGGSDDELPGYDEQGFYDHAGFGMGPEGVGIKQGSYLREPQREVEMVDDVDGEVVEIRLPDAEEEEENGGKEMVEVGEGEKSGIERAKKDLEDGW